MNNPIVNEILTNKKDMFCQDENEYLFMLPFLGKDAYFQWYF